MAAQLPTYTLNGQASCPFPGHVLSFIDSIRTRSTPLLDTPSMRRKQGEVSPNFMPRRSGRLAKADRGLDLETKA